MGFVVEAACGCDTGRVRKNNEDNICFGVRVLPQEHNGLASPLKRRFRTGMRLMIGVFDGMGGENFGEAASWAAARRLCRENLAFWRGRKPNREYLERLVQELNNAVVDARRQFRTDRMGTTMAMLCLDKTRGYVCNVGDSRVYRLRRGKLELLTEDHVMKISGRRKTPLTQNLGIDPEELLIEPHIRELEPERGDCFLLCSDGLTDMLTDSQIQQILDGGRSSADCVRELISAALERGGRDNVTAVVCRMG